LVLSKTFGDGSAVPEKAEIKKLLAYGQTEGAKWNRAEKSEAERNLIKVAEWAGIAHSSKVQPKQTRKLVLIKLYGNAR
jgi:hypothetical protein